FLKRGRIVLRAGDKPDFTGIVLSGLLHILREDYDGNRSIITPIVQGESFAEVLSCAGISESPVTVITAADSAVMLLRFSRILDVCTGSCSFHKQLITNMLRLIAGKNLFLQNRIEILSLKSVRARVMIYLESFIPEQGRNIKIPFNREEMADFLGVERSALSHELAKMKKDGLIDYRKNSFKLKPLLR
ncbi:MAG: Crp/Fnr family transcriptional regulator, partial [Treponema sp.]|nr:Crp/Fnr family transcriptional regulator [Treponema sp.]